MSNTRKVSANGHSEPAVFDLDAVQRETRREPFTFRLGGRQFTVPHMRDLPYKPLLEADGGDTRAALAALRTGLGDDAAEFDDCDLTVGGIDSLFDAWLEHSGLGRGESQASTGS